MLTQLIKKTDIYASDSYQIIKDEQLASLVIDSQILAGSHISKCIYQQVVFTECVFYACEFQGVIFENCVFENCSFEFSHLRNCELKNCSFHDCNWLASSQTNTIYTGLEEKDRVQNEKSGLFILPIAC